MLFSHNSWKWKPTLDERWLELEGPVFHWTMIMRGRVNHELCQQFASLPKNHEQIMLLSFCHDQAQIIGVYYGIAVCFYYFLSSRGRSQFEITGFTQTSSQIVFFLFNPTHGQANLHLLTSPSTCFFSHPGCDSISSSLAGACRLRSLRVL